jgi:hypothetical protein
MSKKRAQGLSIHTIIVAILGLLILAAIVLILSGRVGDFSEGANDEVCAGENLWAKLGWGETPCVGGSTNTDEGGLPSSEGRVVKNPG